MEILQNEIYVFVVIICLIFTKRIYTCYIEKKHHNEILNAIADIKTQSLNEINISRIKPIIKYVKKSIRKPLSKIKKNITKKNSNTPLVTNIIECRQNKKT